jgi:hypothetical protein
MLVEQHKVVHHPHHRPLGHHGRFLVDDMLAGLSIIYCLRMPPCVWASAAGAKASAVSNPAITAARRLSIIAFLPLIEALRRGRLPGIAIYLSSQTSMTAGLRAVSASSAVLRRRRFAVAQAVERRDRALEKARDLANVG